MSEDVEQASREPEKTGSEAPPQDVALRHDPEERGQRTGKPGWFAVYLAAFALVVAATAVMAFGGLSLLRSGSTIEGSTSLFWVSIVLAMVSIVLAMVSIVLARRQR